MLKWIECAYPMLKQLVSLRYALCARAVYQGMGRNSSSSESCRDFCVVMMTGARDSAMMAMVTSGPTADV